MLRFATPRARRKPSLTPMIDVVFLLLVFFMLASQFGREAVVPLSVGGGGGGYSGPPRLVEIAPEGVTLNGVEMREAALVAALSDLTEHPGNTIVLRAGDETRLQRLVDVAERLRAAGFTALAIVE